MYQPEHFRLEDLASLHEVMRAHPLAQLVTAGPGGLMANAVPFILYPNEGEQGVLRAHLARANAQWREIEAGAQALVIFQGREGYVTPSWYAAKREHGKVVPTWNYVVVQARGTIRTEHDPAWLKAQVEALTDRHEAGRREAWAVADAPDAFVAAQLRAIVGIEIALEELSGKFKMSQNRSAADRQGVASGLRAEGRDEALTLASLVESLGGQRP